MCFLILVWHNSCRVVTADNYAPDLVKGNYKMLDSDRRMAGKEDTTRPDERLREVIASLPIVVFSVDHLGRLILLEGRGSSALPRQQDHSLGQHYSEYYSESPALIEAFNRAMSGEAFTTLIKRPGDKIFEVRFYPACDAQGHLLQLSGIAVDVT